MKFSGKNVLVTGSSRGIGAEIAKVLAGSLTEGQVVTTLFEDNTFTVGLVGGPKVTDLDGRVSNIKATDIEASNGVVHVVDKVFLPGILGTRE